MAEKTVRVDFVARIGQYRRPIRQIATETRRFGATVDEASQRAAASTKRLGLASVVIGKMILLGIGAALAVSAKAAIDFESSFAGVRKTLEATEPEFAALAQTIRDMALDIPINVNELNKIAEVGGQLGIQIGNMEEFIEVAAALGVTTNLTAEQAATGLARFANIMGTSQQDFDILGSILVELGNNFATTESEILNFGTRLASIGNTIGLTEDRVFALAAGFTSLGIPAERGATAIQRLFIQMAGAVKSGGEQLDLFAETAGVTSEEFQAIFGADAAEAFLIFLKGLDDIVESGGNVFQTLKDLKIGQQRSIQVLLAGASGWEVLASAMDTAQVEAGQADALFEEAAKRYGTTTSQIRLLINAFNDLRISIGETVIGGIKFLVQWFTDLAMGFRESIEAVKTFGLILLAAAGANILIGIGVGISNVVKALLAMRAASTAAAKANLLLRASFGIVNLVLAAAVVGFGLLANQWRKAAKDARELREAAEAMADAIQVERGDPLSAFTQSLEEQGVVTGEVNDLLLTLGLTSRDFAKAVMGDAEAVANLDRVMENLRATAGIFLGGARPGDLVSDEEVARMEAAEVKYRLLNEAIKAGIPLFQAQEEELRKRRLEETLDSEVIAWTGWTMGVADGSNVFKQAADQTEQSMFQVLGATTEGTEALDEFHDTFVELAEDLTDVAADLFVDISEGLLGSIDPWEKYEGATRLSAAAVRKNLRLMIEDMQSWADLSDELITQVSSRTLAWLDEQPLAIRAGLADLFKGDPVGFDKLVQDLDAAIGPGGRLDVMATQMFGTRLPGLMRQGAFDIRAQVETIAAELETFGVAPAEAIEEAINIVIANLPPTLAAIVEPILTTEAELRNQMRMAGERIGEGLIEGIMAALAKTSERLSPRLRNIKKLINEEFGIRSPSKVTIEIGRQIAEGLIVGFESGAKTFEQRLGRSLDAFTHPATVFVVGSQTEAATFGLTNALNQYMIILNRLRAAGLGQGLQIAEGLVTDLQGIANLMTQAAAFGQAREQSLRNALNRYMSLSRQAATSDQNLRNALNRSMALDALTHPAMLAPNTQAPAPIIVQPSGGNGNMNIYVRGVWDMSRPAETSRMLDQLETELKRRAFSRR